MHLKDKYEVVDTFIQFKIDKKAEYIYLIYIDHEEKKLYTFDTKINFHNKREMEYEAGIDLGLEKKYYKMIDTKPLQSDLLDIDGINSMKKNGYINEEKYHIIFALIRKLKIENVLDEE